MRVLFLIGLMLLSIASPIHAETSGSKKVGKTAAANSKVKSESLTASPKDGEYVTTSSTHIDFSETSIDGKMKSPDGFMLQGRQASQLSQMVKLRSNFRNELNNSKSATRAIVK